MMVAAATAVIEMDPVVVMAYTGGSKVGWRGGEDGSGGVVVAKGMAAMMSEMMDGVVGSLAGDGRRRRKNWPENKGAPEKYLGGGEYILRLLLDTFEVSSRSPTFFYGFPLEENGEVKEELRKYFEAHPVKVITDQPIKYILNKTKALGKLAKYVVEPGAYNIRFISRNAVKGQVLANFLLEAPEGVKAEAYFRMPEMLVEKDDIGSWTLFTDGASRLNGSRACLVLIGPSGLEYTYALWLTFPSTNNEAEYEALLVGLRMAQKMNISNIAVKVDSKLVASQINGSYEANKDNMLSKLTSVAFKHLNKEVLVEVLNERSTNSQEVHAIVEEEGYTWMIPNIRCLEEGIWPEDKNKAWYLRAKIGPLQANYVIREIHMGSCGMHIGPRTVVRKEIRQGYYWLTMHEDAKEEVQKCDSCQTHAQVPRLPKTLMTSIMAPWPFYQWGMDILGLLTQQEEEPSLGCNVSSLLIAEHNWLTTPSKAGAIDLDQAKKLGDSIQFNLRGRQQQYGRPDTRQRWSNTITGGFVRQTSSWESLCLEGMKQAGLKCAALPEKCADVSLCVVYPIDGSFVAEQGHQYGVLVKVNTAYWAVFLE
ncbi:reverse transcriptase domain-containing protein [Tanacetum coccineum]